MGRNVKRAGNNSGTNGRGKRTKSKVDRLSSLPDSVLLNILSFLPTTTSVATGNLAKRWRFLWTQVPVLDFDFRRDSESDFYFDSDYNSDSDYDDGFLYSVPRRAPRRDLRYPKMGSADFIHRVLLQHEVKDLDSFRLWYSLCDISYFQLHTFLSTALPRRVKSLDLDCGSISYSDCKHEIKLPSSLFCCETLVVLKLTGYFIHIKMGSSVSLLSLRELHLESVEFADYEIFGRMVSSSPVIEKLYMQCVGFRSLSKFRLSSHTLEYLTMKSIFVARDCEFQIYTPSLRHLMLRQVCPQSLFAPSLLEADIGGLHPTRWSGFCENVFFNFVNALSEIKLLTLSCTSEYLLQSINFNFGALTTHFRNLKRLRFDGDCGFLFKLLEHAENLECFHWTENDENPWTEPVEVPKCLLSHVNTIVYKHVFTYNHSTPVMINLPMIQYLLENGLVLDNLTIQTRPRYELLSDASQKVSSLKKASAKCLVSVVEDYSELWD